MEICIETLQRISCSRLIPWEGQLQSKWMACWVPCRRSAPTQGLLEPVDWCLEIPPGKNLTPWWLLAQIHIRSWSSGRTNLKSLLLCLDLVCLFAKQSKSNPQHTEHLSIGYKRDLSLQHLSLCAITSNTHVLFLSPAISIWSNLENILSNTRMNFSVKYFQDCFLASKKCQKSLGKERYS